MSPTEEDIFKLGVPYVFVSEECRCCLTLCNPLLLDVGVSSYPSFKGVKIVRDVGGASAQAFGDDDVLGAGYVFTVDNLSKMLSISLRLQVLLLAKLSGRICRFALPYPFRRRSMTSCSVTITK